MKEATEEPLLTAILDTVGSLVVVLDTDGRILKFNRACQKTTGYSFEEAQNRIVWDFLITQEESPEVKKVFAGLKAGDFPNQHQNYWVCKNGSLRTIDWTNTCIANNDGQVTYVIGSGIDITEQYLTRETLEKYSKDLSDIKFALDQSAIVAVTDQKGIIRYANEKFCEISKYAKEELLGQDHRIINSRYHSKEFMRNLWETIANGKVWKGELRNRAKDGSIYWVDTTIVPFLNEKHKPYQYIAIRAEITARKKAEQRLSVEHDVTGILSATPSFNEAGPLLLEAICRNLHCSIGEIFLKDEFSHVLRCAQIWNDSSVLAPRFEAATRLVTFKKGKGLHGRVWACKNPVWIEDVINDENFLRIQDATTDGIHGAFAFPILLEENVIGSIGIFTKEILFADDDLIQTFTAVGRQIGQFLVRKRIEADLEQHAQQLHLFEEKLRSAEKLMIMGMLASEIAHEVGTPLNIISGRVELLSEREKSNDLVRKDLEIINQQIERISKIIRSRLDVTRRVEGRISRIDLSRLIAGLCEFLHAHLEKARITLKLAMKPGVWIEGDEDQLQQVFLNVLMNAIEAIEKGGEILVQTGLPAQGDGLAEVIVRDNGPGIDPENLEKVFDPFFSTKKERGGTGVGLSVVRDIIKRHRGEILVESKPNIGTTFRVRIPLSS